MTQENMGRASFSSYDVHRAGSLEEKKNGKVKQQEEVIKEWSSLEVKNPLLMNK